MIPSLFTVIASARAQSPVFSDAEFEEAIYSGDNDGIGVWFRTTDMANGYLVVMADGGDARGSGTGAPTPINPAPNARPAGDHRR